MDNYDQVIQQMEAFGVEWKHNDLPLTIGLAKRKTCGLKGKWWYWLQTFRTDSGREYIVGRFGCYKHGGSDEKVNVDWTPLSDAERARKKAEHEAALERRRAEAEREAELAAMTAAELWHRATRTGSSPYLERKQVEGEACRFLPDGSLVFPLLRYDYDRDQALRALQRIYPTKDRVDSRTGERLPEKSFTKGFSLGGCSLRLGQVDAETWLVMICEGYATGLSIRMATARAWPVFVALNAWNLEFVTAIVRELYPNTRLLICADDDWKTADQNGPNAGKRSAMRVARAVPGCDLVCPVFDPKLRQDKDTDFNDLHVRQGLATVERQLMQVISVLEQHVAAHD